MMIWTPKLLKGNDEQLKDKKYKLKRVFFFIIFLLTMIFIAFKTKIFDNSILELPLRDAARDFKTGNVDIGKYRHDILFVFFLLILLILFIAGLCYWDNKMLHRKKGYKVEFSFRTVLKSGLRYGIILLFSIILVIVYSIRIYMVLPEQIADTVSKIPPKQIPFVINEKTTVEELMSRSGINDRERFINTVLLYEIQNEKVINRSHGFFETEYNRFTNLEKHFHLTVCDNNEECESFFAKNAPNNDSLILFQLNIYLNSSIVGMESNFFRNKDILEKLRNPKYNDIKYPLVMWVLANTPNKVTDELYRVSVLDIYEYMGINQKNRLLLDEFIRLVDSLEYRSDFHPGFLELLKTNENNHNIDIMSR